MPRETSSPNQKNTKINAREGKGWGNRQFVGEDRHEAKRGTRRETKAFINSNMQKTRRGKQGVKKETTPVRSRARLEAPEKKSRHFVPLMHHCQMHFRPRKVLQPIPCDSVPLGYQFPIFHWVYIQPWRTVFKICIRIGRKNQAASLGFVPMHMLEYACVSNGTKCPWGQSRKAGGSFSPGRAFGARDS